MSCLDIDDAEALSIAEPMMNEVIQGIARRDYALHSGPFSVHLKSQGSRESFLEECDQREIAWGAPGARELVCIFRKPKSFTLVWLQAFSKSDGEIMLAGTVALKGGRYFIDQFLLH